MPLEEYAWPGGYPLYYIAVDGAILCAACAGLEEERPVADIHWEGEPMHCAECNAELPSAYGEPEERPTTMRHRHRIVIEHHGGRVQINGRTHRNVTQATYRRLARALRTCAYYSLLTNGAMIHHCHRGKRA